MDVQANTVEEFCQAHRISRGTFYNLLKDNRGPRLMKVRGRTLISTEAGADWRREMEKGVVGAPRPVARAGLAVLVLVNVGLAAAGITTTRAQILQTGGEIRDEDCLMVPARAAAHSDRGRDFHFKPPGEPPQTRQPRRMCWPAGPSSNFESGTGRPDFNGNAAAQPAVQVSLRWADALDHRSKIPAAINLTEVALTAQPATVEIRA